MNEGTKRVVVAALAIACFACGPSAEKTTRPGRPADAAAVEAVLDDWHDAAAQADEQRYFSHFAADAVFLGTDGGERWTVEDFQAYAHPIFAAGRGWTYTPRDRRVMFSNGGDMAWFDEKLHSEKHGELRGTGVLRRTPRGWKLVHYNMAFTIPNELTPDVVNLIRTSESP